MLAFATGLSELFLAVSIAGGIAGKLGAGTTFLGIIAVAGGIAAVIAALSGILAIPGVEKFLSGGMEKIGKLIGTLIGSMKAAEFEAFNKAISNMESVAPVDQSKVNNATEAAQTIANFASGLPEKGVVEQIADRLFGSELWQFSRDMAEFGTGFNSFAKQIMSIWILPQEELKKRTSTAVLIAEQISKFAETLPKKTILKQVADCWFGSELAQFSGDMVAFGGGFNSFVKEIMSLDDSYSREEVRARTNVAIGIASAINMFGTSLKDKTIPEKIIDNYFGSELNQFTSDMTTFATKFNDYTRIISSITADKNTVESNTDNAIVIADKIAAFLNSLSGKNIETKHKGILGWFETETTGETVFDSIKRLGESIVGSQDSFSGISSSTLVSDVAAATSVAESVAKMLSYLGSGDVYSNITAGAQGLDALGSMFNDSEFSLATIIKDFASQMESIDNLPEVSNIFSGFGLLAGSISSNESVTNNFANAGKTLAVQLVIALAGELGSDENVQKITTAEIKMIDAVVSVLEAMKFKFEYLGRMMDQGIANGLEQNSSLVTQMAESVAWNAYLAAKKRVQVASPSKRFLWLGEMMDEGLVVGLKSYGQSVSATAGDVAEGAVDMAAKGILAINDVLGFSDIDQPVIRPVVDLSNVHSANDEMIKFYDTAFGRLPVSTVMAKQIAADIDMSKKPSNHDVGPISVGSGGSLRGGGNSGGNDAVNGIEWTGSITELGNKFDRLAERMANMQVVLDTGEFVGATSSAYDKQFGKMTGRRERGN